MEQHRSRSLASHVAASPRPLARALVVVIAALAALVVAWSTAAWGSGLDNDSVDYLAAARSLVGSAGWLASDGKPLTLWPPLWPTLLAIGAELGLGFGDATRAWNALATFALVVLCADVTWRTSRSQLAAVGVALAVATAPAIHGSAVMGLSETLFLALVIASLRFLHEHLETATRRTYLLCALFAALAFLQRYLGLALVVSASAAVLLAPTARAWRDRLMGAVGFAALCSLPIAGWCVRNYVLSGHLTGARGVRAGLTWNETFQQSWATLVQWFAPTSAGAPLTQALVAILFVVVIAVAALRVRDRASAWVVFAFPAVYLALSSWFNHQMRLDGIGDRQMLPLAPALWWMFALAAVGAVEAMRGVTARRATAGVCALGLVIHLATDVRTLQPRILEWRDSGAGVYTTRYWRESEFVRELRAMQFDGEIESNDPHAVYLFTGRTAAALPQRATGFRRLTEGDGVRARTLVWFEFNARAVFPMQLLADVYDVTTLTRHPKGAVYRLAVRRRA